MRKTWTVIVDGGAWTNWCQEKNSVRILSKAIDEKR